MINSLKIIMPSISRVSIIRKKDEDLQLVEEKDHIYIVEKDLFSKDQPELNRLLDMDILLLEVDYDNEITIADIRGFIRENPQLVL